MYRFKNSAALGGAALALLSSAPVAAQGVAEGTNPVAPAARFVKLPAREVAARLSRATGVPVVADKTVAATPVTLDVPPGALEATLARVAAALPKGTLVKKVLLPAPAGSAAAPDGDQVAALAAAQEALTPRTGAANGEVVIQGKSMAPDKAAPVIAALGLRPVYLLTNPTAADDPVQKMNAAQLESLKTWLAMTPEQQTAVVDQQFNGLMNMDPALRQQLFSQQRQVMQGFFQRVQSLPEEHRRQFLRELTGGKWDGNPRPRTDGPGTGAEPRQP